ncbi:glycosyltransferase family 4 protein [Raoultella planticola]|uniref:glycosyltransferase family 4 protein n=1 Tax=Raoultella planticola TaxID=575 RepID=UPI003B79670A
MIIMDLMATQSSPEAAFHGGGEYAKCVFYSAIKNEYKDFTAVYNNTLELDADIAFLCKENNIALIPVSSSAEMVKFVNSHPGSKFYSALPYSLNGIDTSIIKFIITIHGLRELECPHDEIVWDYTHGLKNKIKVLLKNYILKKHFLNKTKNNFERLAVRDNIKIFTVSNHSKYSILSFFPTIDKDNILVFRAPCPFGPNEPECKNNELLPFGNRKFFLLVSGNRWQKNIVRALRALDNYFDKVVDCELNVIITGCKVPLIKLRNEKRFIFIDYVERSTLDWLYKNAFCFIYPSLNEGYGYPPLQAMRYGTPVLASCSSSIPEVCSDNVLYFDPRNISEIENRILQLYTNSELYHKLALKGRLHYKNILEAQDADLSELLMSIFDERLSLN